MTQTRACVAICGGHAYRAVRVQLQLVHSGAAANLGRKPVAVSQHLRTEHGLSEVHPATSTFQQAPTGPLNYSRSSFPGTGTGDQRMSTSQWALKTCTVTSRSAHRRAKAAAAAGEYWTHGLQDDPGMLNQGISRSLSDLCIGHTMSIRFADACGKIADSVIPAMTTRGLVHITDGIISFRYHSKLVFSLRKTKCCCRPQLVFTSDVHKAYSVDGSQIMLRYRSATLMTRLAPYSAHLSDFDAQNARSMC